MSDMTRAVLIWIAFGIAGIAVAIGIGIAAAEISSERIGLSSEPLSAGEDLAPRRHTPPDRAKRPATTKPDANREGSGQTSESQEGTVETPNGVVKAPESAEETSEEAGEHEGPDDDD